MDLVSVAVSEAREECSKFLSASYSSSEKSREAFQPVMKAVQRVIVATNLNAGLSKSDAAVLEVYHKYREIETVRQDIKVNITQDGAFIKEDSITCPEGCHILAKQVYKVSLEELEKYGVGTRDLASGIRKFLDDPDLGLPSLASTMLN